MRGIILLVLAVAGTPIAAVSAHASSPSGVVPLRPPPEVSILPVWARYSGKGSGDLLGFPGDSARAEREMSRLAGRLRPAVAAASGGAGVVDAFRAVLLGEEGFTYDPAPGSPENYLLDTVLSRKRGNCLGLSLLWLSLAERLNVPFRGVYVPGHCFVRYDGEDARVNVEFADGGAAWEDDRYRREFRLGQGRPYLRSLTRPETLGVFFKSLGAAYSKKGKDAEALRMYAEAERMNPELPDAPYNAGISLQRLGQAEAAIAKYRRALLLDQDMAAARDNLGILLARRGSYAEAIAEARRAVELEPGNAAARGNLAATYCACGDYDAGIREFRRAAEIAPGDGVIRAGLARAYYAQGRYEEAARECDRAEALGCRFEPAMLEALRRYREPAPAAGGLP
jgi:Flp pilus assembly protein TadD